MLKILIDHKQTLIEQSFSCKEETADTLALIIDRIIIDEYIKTSEMTMNLPVEEQCKIVLEQRNQMLELINNHSIETEYIYSSENTDILQKEVESFLKSMK